MEYLFLIECGRLAHEINIIRILFSRTYVLVPRHDSLKMCRKGIR